MRCWPAPRQASTSPGQHLPAGDEQPGLHSVRVAAEQGRPAVGHHPAARADQLPAGTDVAIMIALAYGMRRGEVLGLHWSALDGEVGTLRVTHGVRRIKNRDKTSDRRTSLVVSELKTQPGSDESSDPRSLQDLMTHERSLPRR